MGSAMATRPTRRDEANTGGGGLDDLAGSAKSKTTTTTTTGAAAALERRMQRRRAKNKNKAATATASGLTGGGGGRVTSLHQPFPPKDSGMPLSAPVFSCPNHSKLPLFKTVPAFNLGSDNGV